MGGALLDFFQYSLVVVTTSEGTEFLLDEKDSGYPWKEDIGKRTFYGGRLELAEDPRAGLGRILARELPTVAAQMAPLAEYFLDFHVEARGERVVLHLFEIRVNQDQFEDWAHELYTNPVAVTEGYSVVMGRTGLKSALQNPEAFLPWMNEVIETYLAQAD